MLDGLHATAFATTGHNHDSSYVKVTGDNMSGTLFVFAGDGYGVVGWTRGIHSGVNGSAFGTGCGVSGYTRGTGLLGIPDK